MGQSLRIMMLSWEFPPRIIGGISSHVYNLSHRLVRSGLETYVITCDFPGAPDYEENNGLHVVRVDSYKSPSPDFATWVYLMNTNMQRESAALINNLGGQVDVIHSHDWLVANAAIGLKHIFRIPLVSTIHSTEAGRRNGLHTNYERMIHQTETWLTNESWKVICCSKYMASQVRSYFGLPEERIAMIPNGIEVNMFPKEFDKDQFRAKFAALDEKIVLFVGRLVYEKGVHVLIGAAQKVLRRINAKFVIAGDGYMKNSLMQQVQNMSLAHKFYFAGFLDCESLERLYECADVCVVPSLYEPFGITALEAMAAGTPLIVSDTGGLSEIVEHDRTGVKTYPNNSDSLAWAITKTLTDTKYANKIKTNALKKVLDEFNWIQISEKTKALYGQVHREYEIGSWKPK